MTCDDGWLRIMVLQYWHGWSTVPSNGTPMALGAPLRLTLPRRNTRRHKTPLVHSWPSARSPFRGTRTKVGDLFDVWRRWCDQTGERPGRKQDFSASLDEHDFAIETYQNVKHVVGLGIAVQGADQGILDVGEVS